MLQQFILWSTDGRNIQAIERNHFPFYVDYSASPMSQQHSAIQIDYFMIIASQIKTLP